MVFSEVSTILLVDWPEGGLSCLLRDVLLIFKRHIQRRPIETIKIHAHGGAGITSPSATMLPHRQSEILPLSPPSPVDLVHQRAEMNRQSGDGNAVIYSEPNNTT